MEVGEKQTTVGGGMGTAADEDGEAELETGEERQRGLADSVMAKVAVEQEGGAALSKPKPVARRSRSRCLGEAERMQALAETQERLWAEPMEQTGKVGRVAEESGTDIVSTQDNGALTAGELAASPRRLSDSAESEMDIGMIKEVRKRPGELKIKTGKGRMKKMHKK